MLRPSVYLEFSSVAISQRADSVVHRARYEGVRAEDEEEGPDKRRHKPRRCLECRELAIVPVSVGKLTSGKPSSTELPPRLEKGRALAVLTQLQPDRYVFQYLGLGHFKLTC